MKIQINSDNNVKIDEKRQAYFTQLIESELKLYESHITRIEAHLSDQDGSKSGQNTKQCMLEARLEDRQPIAVSTKADTVDFALSGAIQKLLAALKTIVAKIEHH